MPLNILHIHPTIFPQDVENCNNGPTIGQSIFKHNKVPCALPKNKDGDCWYVTVKTNFLKLFTNHVAVFILVIQK